VILVYIVSLRPCSREANRRQALPDGQSFAAKAPVGTAEFYRDPNQPKYILVALMIETLLGFLTFNGSLMAMGKLQEVLPQRPITHGGSRHPL